MKFKFLTPIITKLLGIDEEAEKADMYLPVWIAGFGLALFLVGFICIAIGIISGEIGLYIAALFCFAVGVAALLCYRNQRIYVKSDEEFEYSTFLGKKTLYRFEDIKKLKKNTDSMTLFVGEGKVHVEDSAIVSERLKNLINKELAKKYGSEDKKDLEDKGENNDQV